MKKNRLRLFCIGAIATVWLTMFGAPISVFAQTPPITPTPAATPATADGCESSGTTVPIKLSVQIGAVTQVTSLGDYVNTAYKYLASVVLVVAIIMVVYGGFIYLVGSAGISSIQRGKQIIKDALLGMVVVLVAYSILNVVNSNTTKFTLNPPSVACEAYIPGQRDVVCDTDAECPSGQKCVQTSWSFSTEGNFADNVTNATQAGAVGGAVIGAGVGAIPGALFGVGGGLATGFYQSFTARNVCTDGSRDAPCSSTSDCKPNMELECSTDWHLCLMTGANPNGHPCDEDSYCESNNCSGETPKFCRGKVVPLTNRLYSESGYRVPDASVCFTNNDCSESGGLCSGPANSARKFCTLDSVTSGASTSLGALCFLNSAGTVQPSACGGDPFTCMVCPPTGSDRKWQTLNGLSDPGKTRVGSCRRIEDRNTSCSGTP